MAHYSDRPLDDRSASFMAGTQCTGYGAGASHEDIIVRAGGEIGYDGFKDPHPGKDGKMVADRVFISDKDNKVVGVNFSKDGKFCCSYTGNSYEDIKDSNWRDLEAKEKDHSGPTKDGGERYDKFGLPISGSSGQTKDDGHNHDNWRGR